MERRGDRQAEQAEARRRWSPRRAARAAREGRGRAGGREGDARDGGRDGAAAHRGRRWETRPSVCGQRGKMSSCIVTGGRRGREGRRRRRGRGRAQGPGWSGQRARAAQLAAQPQCAACEPLTVTQPWGGSGKVVGGRGGHTQGEARAGLQRAGGKRGREGGVRGERSSSARRLGEARRAHPRPVPRSRRRHPGRREGGGGGGGGGGTESPRWGGVVLVGDAHPAVARVVAGNAAAGVHRSAEVNVPGPSAPPSDVVSSRGSVGSVSGSRRAQAGPCAGVAAVGAGCVVCGSRPAAVVAAAAPPRCWSSPRWRCHPGPACRCRRW